MDAAGNLYAGGRFTAAGGVSANYIAKQDGSAWSPLGTGMNGGVGALAVDRAGNLYAGGTYHIHIWKWGGSHWIVLRSGHSGGNRPGVLALMADRSGSLYAGGDFTSAGGKPSYYIARWTAAMAECGLSAGSSHTLYAGNLPVTVNVTVPGSLECIAVQRFNRSHPEAGRPLQTGYYWEIAGTDSRGLPATGFTLDLTLPTTFIAGATDELCRFAAGGWDCAATSFTASSVTRAGVTQLSDWTAGRQADPGTIGGTVWFDVDGNGARDGSEPGLVGVQITVLRGGTQLEQATTAGDGTYLLASLPPGAYVVRETQPVWLRYSTTPDEVQVTLTAGQHATADFGDWDGIPLWLPMILR